VIVPAVAASPASGLAASAASFARGLVRDGVPADVLARAKANLLCDLMCALGAGERAAPAWRLARGTTPATATLLLDGTRVHVEQAAFANAVLIHARAQDDTHYPSQTHPDAAVIPAALAVGESRRLGVPRHTCSRSSASSTLSIGRKRPAT
jgi:2-methylcitrate dehydratase PrpD